MVHLNQRWRGTLAEAVGLESSIAVRSLAPAREPASTAALWSIQNALPTAADPWNPSETDDGFFEAYQALVPEIAFSPLQLAQVIGAGVAAEWERFLSSQPPPAPSLNQLPGLFRRWALLNAPSAADKGASALARWILIEGAAAALEPYVRPTAPAPVDFSSRLSQLKGDLAAAPECSFSMHTRPHGKPTYDLNPATASMGLWTGSPPDEPLSRKIAVSPVSIAVSFEHFLVVRSVPGAWFSASLLGLAARNRTEPTWRSDADLGWDHFFGANGSLRWTVGALLAVSGITSVVTVAAHFDPQEHERIRTNAHKGTWPLYVAEAAPDVEANDGQLTIRQHTTDRRVVLVGALIQSFAPSA